MALGRLVSKAAKAATKKKGTLKPTKRGNMYTRDKETGRVRSISKKTEERYDRMAEQKVKSNAKKAGKAAGASAGVVGTAAAAGKIAEERKKNEAANKKAAERKAAPKKKTSPAKTSATPPDGRVVMKGIEAGKKSKAKLDKDVKDAKTKRDVASAAKKQTTENARAKASKVTSDMSGAPKAQSYKIKKGDTLSEIAKKYKTSVKTLMNLNDNIKDADKIYAGRTIKLPSEK